MRSWPWTCQMGDNTAIAWTDRTFNPWMGCHKVSAGCKHCYAEELIVNRRQWGPIWGANADRRRTSPGNWAKPKRWNREALMGNGRLRVFCASLADVFEDHSGPNAWRADLFELIRQTPYLDWQLLTKRPENLEAMLPPDWGAGWPNVWLGTSIENAEFIDRAVHLTSVPSVVHFVSYEPALGDLAELPLDDIEWVIFGGESGPSFRPMNMQWARDMRQRCDEEGVAFFYKQSAARRTEMGIHMDGELVRAWPLGRELAR